MQLTPAVIYFPEINQIDAHIRVHIPGGGGNSNSTIVLKCFMLVLLMARPFRNASRLWRGVLLQIASDFLPPLNQESGFMDPKGSPRPSPHSGMSHYRLQSPGSRHFRDPWSATVVCIEE
jgi:hypothetical protein